MPIDRVLITINNKINNLNASTSQHCGGIRRKLYICVGEKKEKEPKTCVFRIGVCKLMKSQPGILVKNKIMTSFAAIQLINSPKRFRARNFRWKTDSLKMFRRICLLFSCCLWADVEMSSINSVVSVFDCCIYAFVMHLRDKGEHNRIYANIGSDTTCTCGRCVQPARQRKKKEEKPQQQQMFRIGWCAEVAVTAIRWIATRTEWWLFYFDFWAAIIFSFFSHALCICEVCVCARAENVCKIIYFYLRMRISGNQHRIILFTRQLHTLIIALWSSVC